MFNKIKIFFLLVVLFLVGCVTVPEKENIPVYNINGVIYYPLVSLCESRGISWQYDTFTRIVVLNKGLHRINLKYGDNLVLVDQRATLLSHPVDIYEGTVVVPYDFKKDVIDVLFKGVAAPAEKKGLYPISNTIKKVVVDAGHGGNDPGAIGKTGLREKDVNLDIAKRLALLLKQEGVEVVMPRVSDAFIPLDKRVQITNNSKADLFISIHSNANRVRSLHGFEVYYVGTNVNDAKRSLTSARNSSLNLAHASLINYSTDVKAMLWDMLYNYDRAESIYLGRNICKSVGDKIDVRVIGLKDARYEVLRGAQMPALLIETGFVSNINEERMLRNGYYRQKLAEGILEGIRDYAQALAQIEESH
jgi:N-acetylmuramoyl-L-alanine amidase